MSDATTMTSGSSYVNTQESTEDAVRMRSYRERIRQKRKDDPNFAEMMKEKEKIRKREQRRKKREQQGQPVIKKKRQIGSKQDKAISSKSKQTRNKAPADNELDQSEIPLLEINKETYKTPKDQPAVQSLKSSSPAILNTFQLISNEMATSTSIISHYDQQSNSVYFHNNKADSVAEIPEAETQQKTSNGPIQSCGTNVTSEPLNLTFHPLPCSSYAKDFKIQITNNTNPTEIPSSQDYYGNNLTLIDTPNSNQSVAMPFSIVSLLSQTNEILNSDTDNNHLTSPNVKMFFSQPATSSSTYTGNEQNRPDIAGVDTTINTRKVNGKKIDGDSYSDIQHRQLLPPSIDTQVHTQSAQPVLNQNCLQQEYNLEQSASHVTNQSLVSSVDIQQSMVEMMKYLPAPHPPSGTNNQQPRLIWRQKINLSTYSDCNLDIMPTGDVIYCGTYTPSLYMLSGDGKPMTVPFDISTVRCPSGVSVNKQTGDVIVTHDRPRGWTVYSKHGDQWQQSTHMDNTWSGWPRCVTWTCTGYVISNGEFDGKLVSYKTGCTTPIWTCNVTDSVYDLATDNDDNIYAVHVNHIRVYNPQGEVIHRIPQTHDSNFDPWSICIDSTGRILVLHRDKQDRYQVSLWTKDGQYISKILDMGCGERGRCIRLYQDKFLFIRTYNSKSGQYYIQKYDIGNELKLC